MTQSNESFQYILFEAGRYKSGIAKIVTEAPVALTVNGQVWLSFMCTPTDLEAMAAGFLFNEGLIQSIDEIASVRLCPSGDNVDVWLNHDVERPEIWKRTSGCTGGITAAQNVETFNNNGKHLGAHMTGPELSAKTIDQSNEITMTPKQIEALIAEFVGSQNLYRQSGGVHTSGLSDGQRIRIIAEDIGRHNTLDKIAGRILLEGMNLPQRVLITTGRVSSEMLQKASRMEATIVISHTSPSSLSIQMAQKQDITLIGYARRTSFRIYTQPKRVQLPRSVLRA